MMIKSFIVGIVSTNCYVLHQEGSNECILIDPGEISMELTGYLADHKLQITAILLTHGHFDHIIGVPKLRSLYTIPVYAGSEEQKLLMDPHLNKTAVYGGAIALEDCVYVADQDVITLAGFKVRVIHTPGHTIGSVCYYLEEEHVLFTGDTLFREEVGRTDLPTGNYQQLLSSLQEVLMLLPDETKVYPGHERDSSIGHERHYNPYVSM